MIVNIGRAIRSVISNHRKCQINKAKPEILRMGDLPSARLEHHIRPFSNCGVDYFGPMKAKIGRRHEKLWGVIFTCLSIRLKHLEIESFLNADSAIMALRRMINRRRPPTTIFSDNGTNLREANEESRKAVLDLNYDELQKKP